MDTQAHMETEVALLLGTKDLQIVRLKARVAELQERVDELEEHSPLASALVEHVAHLREVPRDERTDLRPEPVCEEVQPT